LHHRAGEQHSWTAKGLAGTLLHRRNALLRSSAINAVNRYPRSAHWLMTYAIITGLLLLCGWMGLRLSTANKENAELRLRIESLKRQMRLR
jgi:hypothetical protein